MKEVGEEGNSIWCAACGSVAWLIVVKAREVANVEQAGEVGSRVRWGIKKERKRIAGKLLLYTCKIHSCCCTCYTTHKLAFLLTCFAHVLIETERNECNGEKGKGTEECATV